MTREGSTLFEFDNVSLAGHERARLAGVSLRVPASGVTAVVGPSGAGKSTLLRLCNRLDVPDRGSVRFRGDDIATLDPVHLRRRVGMVFQRATPFDGTVLDNLRVGVPDLHADGAAAVLARAQLDAGFLDRDATKLSGGEAQRMCLARTLATEPEVLLLDEPTAALDTEPRVALERLVCGLVADGLPAVWVTHDLDQMRRVADHVVVLLDGRLAHAGPAHDLATAPRDAARFLSEPLHRSEEDTEGFQ